METKNMSSVPHSAIHARSYVDEVEKKPTNVEPTTKKSEPGVKGMVSSEFFVFVLVQL
jgi:hypothetical protein